MFFILASLAQIMAAAMPAVFTAASASPSELGVTLVGQTLLYWWPNFACPPLGVEGYCCLPQNIFGLQTSALCFAYDLALIVCSAADLQSLLGGWEWFLSSGSGQVHHLTLRTPVQ